MLEQIDTKHDEGHSRLRTDFRQFQDADEKRRLSVDERLLTLTTRIDALRADFDRPLDATRLMLGSRAIIAVVAVALTAAAMWWGVHTDVKDLMAKFDAQQTSIRADAVLRDAQLSSLRDAIAQTQKQADDAKRSYELLRYDLQALKDEVSKKGR